MVSSGDRVTSEGRNHLHSLHTVDLYNECSKLSGGGRGKNTLDMIILLID